MLLQENGHARMKNELWVLSGFQGSHLAHGRNYNDHSHYLQKTVWDGYDCATGAGGDFFKPYLDGGQTIPCDPVTKERYLYITLPENEPNYLEPIGYKLFAALGNLSDQDIPGSGCDPSPYKGCGYEPYKYNYGIAVGATLRNPLFDFEAPTPTPTPQYPPGNWICPPKIGNQPAQNCQYYSNNCRDLVMARGCLTYDNDHKYTCSSLCNPGQQNACQFLSECQ